MCLPVVFVRGTVDGWTCGKWRVFGRELAAFVADVFASVPRRDQRAKGDCYLRGLMLDGRRKSIQPMAERLPDGNEQNLQQFVNQSPWDPVPVRRRIAERMVPLIGPDAWAVDDVSFPKDGRMSVGLGHQYCGALGKQANCQVAVSVHAVTDAASCPLQWRLFLPKEWAQDPARRRITGVPDQIGHREKWRLAPEVLDELAGWGLVPPVVVADAGYGQDSDFRHAVAERHIPWVVGARGDLSVQPHEAAPTTPAWSGNGRSPQPRCRQPPVAVAGCPTCPTTPPSPNWSAWQRSAGASSTTTGNSSTAWACRVGCQAEQPARAGTQLFGLFPVTFAAISDTEPPSVKMPPAWPPLAVLPVMLLPTICAVPA